MKHIPTFISTEEFYECRPAELYRFANGYGASITGDTRYGWNIAVVRFFDLDRDSGRIYRWDDRSDPLTLDYTTPVGSDVVRVEGPDTDDALDILDAIAYLEGKRA
jgi:hypothetical protein